MLVLNEQDRLKIAIAMLISACLTMVLAGMLSAGVAGGARLLLSGYILTFAGSCMGLIFCIVSAKVFGMNYGEIEIVFLKLCAIVSVFVACLVMMPLLAMILGFFIIVGGMVLLFDELTFFEVFVATICLLIVSGMGSWLVVIIGF